MSPLQLIQSTVRFGTESVVVKNILREVRTCLPRTTPNASSEASHHDRRIAPDSPDEIPRQPRRHHFIQPRCIHRDLVARHAELLDDDGLSGLVLRRGVVSYPLSTPGLFIACLAPTSLWDGGEYRSIGSHGVTGYIQGMTKMKVK